MIGWRAWASVAGFLLLAVHAGCGQSAPDKLFGIRLGMTAIDIRSRFDHATEGTWESQAGDLFLLTWSASSNELPVRGARFELHRGVLVAATFSVRKGDSNLPERKIQLSSGSVLSRGSSNGPWVDLRWIARDCPLHTEEIRDLLHDVEGVEDGPR